VGFGFLARHRSRPAEQRNRRPANAIGAGGASASQHSRFLFKLGQDVIEGDLPQGGVVFVIEPVEQRVDHRCWGGRMNQGHEL